MAIKTKKSLGQNFLIDRVVLEQIVNSAEITNKNILEVGPGSGNLTTYILKKNPKTVGFYRLVMKEGSDNFRSSAIQDIIARVVQGGVNVLIYEPALREARFTGFEVSKSLQEFKSKSDVVVSNRFAEELLDIECKVITRDVFGNN